uniref:SP110 nuclear body protein, tandem duplicate 2 n=1 Tax=Sinocyclocheilus rhinocerous TaxID=307959 RepID=A0A673I6B4_9TELE
MSYSCDKQEIWKWPIYKIQLPVSCGDKEGTLYRDKLPEGEKCILSQGRWFTPTDFEKFAGKEKCKNWKLSIRCRNTPLKKLIEVNNASTYRSLGFLGSLLKVMCFIPQDLETSSGSMEESDEEEDMADLSVFQASSLPVTCVSLTGTLYKYRFASGSRGKCIRTEERWFTPEEFVKQELILTDGHWKKNILCHGKPLNFLLKKEILRIHSLLCECVKCSSQEQDNNDDECYVCRSEGDLVCCDECPRAFHSHCHLPTADGDSPGEWICTLCVLRNSQQWRDSSNMSEQEAFNAPVSQYRLVSRYSEVITQPMWLDRIKQKLESGEYQTVGAFVSDFQLIFSNCSKFNGVRFTETCYIINKSPNNRSIAC